MAKTKQKWKPDLAPPRRRSESQVVIQPAIVWDGLQTKPPNTSAPDPHRHTIDVISERVLKATESAEAACQRVFQTNGRIFGPIPAGTGAPAAKPESSMLCLMTELSNLEVTLLTLHDALSTLEGQS